MTPRRESHRKVPGVNLGATAARTGRSPVQALAKESPDLGVPWARSRSAAARDGSPRIVRAGGLAQAARRGPSPTLCATLSSRSRVIVRARRWRRCCDPPRRARPRHGRLSASAAQSLGDGAAKPGRVAIHRHVCSGDQIGRVSIGSRREASAIPRRARLRARRVQPNVGCGPRRARRWPGTRAAGRGGVVARGDRALPRDERRSCSSCATPSAAARFVSR